MRLIRYKFATAVITAVFCLGSGIAAAQQTVRIGQATSSMSFVAIFAARALKTFDEQGLTATAAILSGGDPAALAALDAGDIDLAAVGPEAVLRAAAKGQPFEIVYSLMSKVTPQLVVSSAFLDRTGVKATDPLAKRLATLKGAIVGVSAIGGTQETVARWLAAKGGLDPKADIKVAQVGGPPALQAALENKRIDAFVLSPPEGYLAEKSGAGTVLVSIGDDFPQVARQPYLVLVAKKPIKEATSDLIIRTVKALQAASIALTDEPEPTARTIQAQFFPKADPDGVVVAVKAMNSGIAEGGKLDVAGFQNLLTFSAEVGTDFGKSFDAKTSEGDLWTNHFVDAATAK